MPTIIHFFAAFLSKQVHLDSKVFLKNPYRNGFSCIVQDFAKLSEECPPPKNDSRGEGCIGGGAHDNLWELISSPFLYPVTPPGLYLAIFFPLH